jgi:hypothetical protein
MAFIAITTSLGTRNRIEECTNSRASAGGNMRENWRMLLVGINAALMVGLGAFAHASLVASDNVTNNPPYSGYIDFNGLNGGSGFGPWSVTNTSGTTGGDFTWFNTPLNSPGNGGGFDIYDNGIQGGGLVTDEFAAIRPFTGALAAGQAFSFKEQLNNGSNPGNGGPCNLGFSLDDSSGNVLFNFAVQGGGPGYLLTDATQIAVPETTVPYNYHGIDTFTFALNSVGATSAAYTFTASGASVTGGSQSFSGTISMLTGGVTQADIFNNNGGEGSDVQFDNLAITNVPEPVSFAVLGFGVASLLTRRRSRSR